MKFLFRQKAPVQQPAPTRAAGDAPDRACALWHDVSRALELNARSVVRKSKPEGARK